MKILLTGGKGMLGEAIQEVFKDYTIYSTDKDSLDVRKLWDAFVFKPDYIFHLAAETDLEICETHPEHAYYTNTIGTFNMVEIAKSLNIPIVYISTAGVFGDCDDTWFVESTKPQPNNVYARSKYYGEIAVQNYWRHYIFRISWAFGGGTRDKKFVMKICKQISSGKKEIDAIGNTSGSPSYTRDVAKFIYGIFDTDDYGIYHIPTGEASRYDVACEIIKILNVPVKVNKVNGKQFINYIVKRPKKEVLSSLKMIEVRDWKLALKEYLNEITANKSKS